jgi:hypothetical protein
MKNTKIKMTDLETAEAIVKGKLELPKAKMTSLYQRLGKARGPAKDIDSRICFGIEFYDSEEKAHIAHLISRMQGNTYNGGWFHGMACGRDTSFDYEVKQEHLDNARPSDSLITQKVAVGTKLYAVTN